MPLVLDGTNGVSGVDGTASNPAIEGTDSNTGIFYPAADTVAISTGGTEALRVNSSQQVGIGTTSPASKLHISGGTANTARIDGSSNGGAWAVMRNGSVTGGIYNTGAIIGDTTSGVGIFAETGLDVRFYTNGSATDKARITSGGALWVGNTTRQSTDNHTFIQSVTAGDWTANFQCNTTTAANNLGILVNYNGSAPNGTGSPFLRCNDTANTRAEIRSNGGLANFQANNVNLSDRREKTNFAPAKDYLDVICAIPVQTFNYIDQAEDDPGLTLGVVAQDVEAVAPELVMESDWSSGRDGSKMRLSIYQTDLQYALMKSIQELKAILDAQAAEIAALKGNA